MPRLASLIKAEGPSKTRGWWGSNGGQGCGCPWGKTKVRGKYFQTEQPLQAGTHLVCPPWFHFWRREYSFLKIKLGRNLDGGITTDFSFFFSEFSKVATVTMYYCKKPFKRKKETGLASLVSFPRDLIFHRFISNPKHRTEQCGERKALMRRPRAVQQTEGCPWTGGRLLSLGCMLWSTCEGPASPPSTWQLRDDCIVLGILTLSSFFFPSLSPPHPRPPSFPSSRPLPPHDEWTR